MQFLPELLDRLVTIINTDSHRLFDGPRYLCWNAWHKNVHRSERIQGSAPGSPGNGIGGNDPGQHGIYRRCQSVEVGLRIGPASILLGSSISWRAMANHIGGFILHELFGDPKVHQHGSLALHGNNNVSRFHIPVHDWG